MSKMSTFTKIRKILRLKRKPKPTPTTVIEVKETPKEILKLPKKLREMNIKTYGDFLLSWHYSRCYSSTFSWNEMEGAKKEQMNPNELLKYIKEHKEDIDKIELGSEGHYSIINHWSFIFLKNGNIHAIKLKPKPKPTPTHVK